jgi:hypothetical protein
MRKSYRYPIGISLVVCAITGSVVAQSLCDTERSGDLEPAYLRCLRDERESRNRELGSARRIEIDNQKNTRSLYYQQRRATVDLIWRQAELQLEQQIDFLENRVAYRKISNRDDPEIDRMRLQIDEFKQRRDTLRNYKNRYNDVLRAHEGIEIAHLNLQMASYELSVRDFPRLSLPW